MVDNFDALSWYYHEAGYFTFTRSRSLDFGGFVPREELIADSEDSLANSNNYKRYSNFHVKRLLGEAVKTGIPFENYIDVGCGKGHPCIIGKKYFNFPKVYGIDFCEPLIKVAKENLAKTRYDNVFFEVADATTWKIPDGDSLVLLNNPFNEVIMEKFLVANFDHFKKYRSLIAYGNDIYRSAVCKLGFDVIFRSNKFQHSLLRYNDSPRS
jgi:hypothetical protein